MLSVREDAVMVVDQEAVLLSHRRASIFYQRQPLGSDKPTPELQ